MLCKDQELAADIRLAIARECLLNGKSQSVEAGAVKSSLIQQGKAKQKISRSARSYNGRLANLEILLGLVQGISVPADRRRKAAAEAARQFLPMKPGVTRWWENAPADEYGFAITAKIAAEYRDLKFDLRRLERSRANSVATARRAQKMRERILAILHRLQCPCPSLYGNDQWATDGHRLNAFVRQRNAKVSLSAEEDAEEAHCKARFDCFVAGPESIAVQRVSKLRDKEDRFRNGVGWQLTWKEQVELRYLRLLYPTRNIHYDPEKDNFYYPFKSEPLAADGNMYPADSKLKPLVEGEIEEFLEVPPDRDGHPDYPGLIWTREPPA